MNTKSTIDQPETNTISMTSGTSGQSVQVKPKQQRSPRRSFSKSYKLQILNAFDACGSASERGALLRKEGLYHSRLDRWRKQLADGQLHAGKSSKTVLANQQLARENATLKKKLAQAEAIIELQKKVSELLSQHILEPEMSEEKL